MVEAEEKGAVSKAVKSAPEHLLRLFRSECKESAIPVRNDVRLFTGTISNNYKADSGHIF